MKPAATETARPRTIAGNRCDRDRKASRVGKPGVAHLRSRPADRLAHRRRPWAWPLAPLPSTSPQYARNHLRRLHWLLSEESGGVCPRAPEAMAEIVHHQPRLYAQYAPIIVSLLSSMAEDLEHFRRDTLGHWPAGPTGGRCIFRTCLSEVVSALDDCNPAGARNGVLVFGQTGQAQFLADRPALLADEGAG